MPVILTQDEIELFVAASPKKGKKGSSSTA